MTEFFYYLIKVMICSGVFYLYYHFALKNRSFHQWNRFYLLTSVIISLCIPLLQFTFYQTIQDTPSQTIRILKVVESASLFFEDATVSNHKPAFNPQWILFFYYLVSSIFFMMLVISIIRITRYILRYKRRNIQDIVFINTSLESAPFSFLQFIFWNEAINLESETGQQIFKHELVHSREKHSLDNIFIQIVLVFFWINPFFWIVRKELKLIHEFIADRKVVKSGSTETLAAMILQAAYPKQFNTLVNPFFQTSIKRRIHMLTKIQRSKIHYFNRILALPILVCTLLAFTVKTSTRISTSQTLKDLTVVIDAGHGKMSDGNYNGARLGDLYEDDIVLAIARKVKQQNKNNKINIVLTRSTQDIIDLKKRIEIAVENKADLFISIHASTNPENSDSSGMKVYVSSRNVPFQKQSEIVGSILQTELQSLYPTKPFLIKPAAGVMILDKNICPSILVECGYLTNEKDRAFMIDEINQARIAEKILNAVNSYALYLEKNPVGSKETIQE